MIKPRIVRMLGVKTPRNVPNFWAFSGWDCSAIDTISHHPKKIMERLRFDLPDYKILWINLKGFDEN
jgi:hypothetical protein